MADDQDDVWVNDPLESCLEVERLLADGTGRASWQHVGTCPPCLRNLVKGLGQYMPDGMPLPIFSEATPSIPQDGGGRDN